MSHLSLVIKKLSFFSSFTTGSSNFCSAIAISFFISLISSSGRISNIKSYRCSNHHNNARMIIYLYTYFIYYILPREEKSFSGRIYPAIITLISSS